MNNEPCLTRVIHCFGPIDDGMANKVIARLLYFQAEDGERPISLVLNSPGGEVTAALAILDTMRFVTPPVWTRALTQASGMALLLLAGGEPGHRVALEDSYLCWSSPKHDGALRGPETVGYLQMLHERLGQELADLTRMTPEEAGVVVERGRDFTTADAVALGLVDEVPEAT